jgi:hypothetical protein
MRGLAARAAFLVACALALGAATGARAQLPPDGALPRGPAPWRPSGLDSTRLWCLQARALLSDAKSDTVGPSEARAYRLLDRVVQTSLHDLGPAGMRSASATLAVFDSVKLDVEMAQDPKLPQFVVFTYFNPAFAGYGSWTTIFWWRGDELMSQSIGLEGGRRIQMSVWWTGNQYGPYEMGLVDYRRTGDGNEGFFSMLRMSRNADFWGAVQYGRKSFSLGGPGPARFVDLNGDGTPELVNWVKSDVDPRFIPDANLPPLLLEQTWQREDDGFAPLDRRSLPTPFATFVLFLRALGAGQAALARSLCNGPVPYAEAVRLKLGLVTAKNSWHVGETPNPEPWRSDFAFGYGTPGHLDKELRVILRPVSGHWLIDTVRSPKVPAKAVP